MIWDTAISIATHEYDHDGAGWYDYYTGGHHGISSTSYHHEDDDDHDDAPAWAMALMILRHLVGWAYTIWILIVFIRARQLIMARSNITAKCCPGACNGGLESCCVGFWCGCCAVSQMARHTGDYTAYRAACCTETGMVEAPSSYPGGALTPAIPV